MREHHPHHREHGDGHDGFEKRPGRERGGRGPRVFAPGDLKLLLLALIAEQPCHGYDLIRQIEGMFDGAYSPSPGVIYPTLLNANEKTERLNLPDSLKCQHTAKLTSGHCLYSDMGRVLAAITADTCGWSDSIGDRKSTRLNSSHVF